MSLSGKYGICKVNWIESNGQNGNWFVVKPRNYNKFTLNMHLIPKLSSLSTFWINV
jgi:hypothetical protein